MLSINTDKPLPKYGTEEHKEYIRQKEIEQLKEMVITERIVREIDVDYFMSLKDKIIYIKGNGLFKVIIVCKDNFYYRRLKSDKKKVVDILIENNYDMILYEHFIDKIDKKQPINKVNIFNIIYHKIINIFVF